MRPWESLTVRCGLPTRSGRPCREFEIAGLGACFHHIEADLLEEAELITGLRRCRARWGTPDWCTQIAVSGTDAEGPEHARCKVHGANAGSVLSRRAARVIVLGRAGEAAAEIAALPENAESLLHPPPLGNPLQELLDAAAVAKEWERITRSVLAYLTTQTYRQGNGRIGEQVRAEILIHQQALATLLTVLERICRLNLESKLAGIREQTAQHLEQQLEYALEASGVDHAGRAKARARFRRGLRIVA